MPEPTEHSSDRDTRPVRASTDVSLRGQAGRVPPQAVDVEQAVLGAMLLEKDALASVIAVLEPEAFYQPKHEKIYVAMRGLFKRNTPVDLITVTEELRRQGDLEAVGGAYYLSDLSTLVASAANVEHHARIVVEKSLLRTLIETMSQRIGQAYDPAADAFELLDQAESDLFQISESQLRRSADPLKKVLMDTLYHLESIRGRSDGVTGVPSGFSALDRLTGGWQNSDLVIIAARPSMGKCLAFDAEILLADGSLATIESIHALGEADVLTLRGDGRFYTTQPSAFIYDGLKPVFRVTTRLGRRVDTTLSHPFLSPDGWQPLSFLRPGDRLAVPRVLPVFGNQSLPASQVLALADATIGSGAPRTEESSGDTVAIATPRLAQQIRVPAVVLALKEPLVALFLRRLFLRSGHVSPLANGRRQIGLWTKSPRFARDVQHLLLRFGVLARRNGSRLTISETRSVALFATRIGLEEPALPASVAAGQPEIYWDEIVSIEALGIKPVYDLTIPETHNFVADDVCVHNTAFALACARNAAMHRERPTGVAIFSLEMSAQQLGQRLITAEARVNAQDARTGRLGQKDFENLVHASSNLSESSIFLDDTPGLGILELRAKARRLRSQHGIGLVIVDYLQLMHGTNSGNRNSNREQEIAQISRSLKALAKELNIPVIALSQLNRSVESRPKNKRPILSDLRESGSIEQDADVVAFIYRAEMYGIQYDDNGESLEGIGEIIIGKQRNGPTGTAKLAFLKHCARFENLSTYRRSTGVPAGAIGDGGPDDYDGPIPEAF